MKLISTTDTIELVPHREILYFEAYQNYTKVHLVGSKMLLSKDPLSTFQNDETLTFFRIHNTFIVNILNVMRYHNVGEVELINHVKLPVARRRKTAFVAALKIAIESANSSQI